MSLLPYVRFHEVNDHNRKVMGDSPSYSGILNRLESELKSRNFGKGIIKSYTYFAERFLYSMQSAGKSSDFASQNDMDMFISSIRSPRGKTMASYALKSLFELVLIKNLAKGRYEQLRLDRLPTA